MEEDNIQKTKIVLLSSLWLLIPALISVPTLVVKFCSSVALFGKKLHSCTAFIDKNDQHSFSIVRLVLHLIEPRRQYWHCNIVLFSDISTFATHNGCMCLPVFLSGIQNHKQTFIFTLDLPHFIECRVATVILQTFWEGATMNLLYVGNLYKMSTTLGLYPVSSVTLCHGKWLVIYPESSYKIMYSLSSSLSPL